MHNVSERLAFLGAIDPASQSIGEKLTPAISLAQHRRLVFTISTGVMGASGTLDFTVKGATSAGGTYAAIPGTSIVQIVKASGDNVQAIVEISPIAIESLGLGYTHVKGSLTPGTAASLAGVTVHGAGSRYSDASFYEGASVVQKVALVN